MKKASAVILAVITAAVLMLTAAVYCFKNMDSGALHIRSLPTAGSAAQASDPPTESGVTALVNINTAGLGELATLPGIGEVLAQRIITYREEHGPFESAAGLLNVAGIGEKKLEAILDLITTGGTT